MKNLSIKVADNKDFVQIYELLKEEYVSNNFFKLIDDSFLREDNSSNTKILVVKENNKIISTMRGSLIMGGNEMGSYMDNYPLDKEMFPSLLLTRAATDKSAKRNGINSLMRYHFIKKSLEENISSLSGFVSKGMSRVRLLTRLGYSAEEFRTNTKVLQSYDEYSLFVNLRSEKYLFALSLLENELNGLHNLEIENESEFSFRSQ